MKYSNYEKLLEVSKEIQELYDTYPNEDEGEDSMAEIYFNTELYHALIQQELDKAEILDIEIDQEYMNNAITKCAKICTIVDARQ